MFRKITLAAAVVIAGATAAFAHITLETQEAKIGSTYKAVLRVPHGCDGKATKTVRVQIPEGVIAVKPMPKAGWKLETVKGKYEKSYDLYGAPVGEGVKEVVWSGGDLPDEFYDEFVFRAMLTDSLAAGDDALFPDGAGMRRRHRTLDRDPRQGPGRGCAGVSGAGAQADAEGIGSRALKLMLDVAPLCPAGHLPHKGGDRPAAMPTLDLQRWRLAKRSMTADLPPCGGDVRQDRGGQRRAWFEAGLRPLCDRLAILGVIFLYLLLLPTPPPSRTRR